MKIIVFSDSHGYTYNLKKAVEKHLDANLLIHLGDGQKDIETVMAEHPNIKYPIITNKHPNKKKNNFFKEFKITLTILPVLFLWIRYFIINIHVNDDENDINIIGNEILFV